MAKMLTLSVVYECAMRNFQRAPFIIWHFQRMFQPSKGQLFRVRVGFYQNLHKLEKLIEVRKRSAKDKKAKTPAKQKPGTKRFLYQYRLSNDIRHLWNLASELICLFCLSLPGIFKNTLSGLSNFRSDFYPHQVVSIYRNFYKKKNQMQRKNDKTSNN